MSLRDVSRDLESTTWHKNPSQPHPSSLWAFIAEMSPTPSFRDFPLWTTLSLLGSFRVIFFLGQSIWASYLHRYYILRLHQGWSVQAYTSRLEIHDY